MFFCEAVRGFGGRTTVARKTLPGTITMLQSSVAIGFQWSPLNLNSMWEESRLKRRLETLVGVEGW